MAQDPRSYHRPVMSDEVVELIRPVMPGVIIIEAMAQAGAVLLFREVQNRDDKLLYFTSIDEAKFRRPVGPGDQLRLEVTVIKYKMGYAKLRAEARVDGHLVTEATIASVLADKNKRPADRASS